MNKAQWKSIAGVVFAALYLAAAVYAGETHRGFDSRTYDQTSGRDDQEVLVNPAGAVCVLGHRTRQHANPAVACFVAYEHALRGGRYQEAMYYAAWGCEKHRNPADCRRVGGLPLVLGNQGIAVPASFATEVRRVAEFVCFSGARLRHSGGIDVTDVQCSYLARQFRLASDPEYAFALEPAARQYFAATEDVAFSGRLHQAACERHGHGGSCERLAEIGRRIDERDLAQGYETLEREAGERLVRADVAIAGLAYEGALAAQRFDDALRYAAIGCERHRDARLCLRVAELPVRMGEHNVRASPALVGEVQRIGKFVCQSGASIRNANGNDVTATICTHFAAQFVLARDANR